MYIPLHFRNNNRQELPVFILAHPLSLIAGNGQDIPFAAHLPFVIREKDETLLLTAHFAAAMKRKNIP